MPRALPSHSYRPLLYWLLFNWLYLTLIFSMPIAAKTPIVYAQTTAKHDALALSTLQLAIQKSGRSQRYRYQSLGADLSDAELAEALKKKSISVMWAGTRTAYESELRPIRIPVFKGLLGHRVLLIRSGDQHVFNPIETITALRALQGGQGRFSNHTPLLRRANLPIITATKEEGLFHMLDGSRFDFLPRGIHEAWDDVARHQSLSITVEQSTLIIYPYPIYFFVSSENKALGDSIEVGFRNAVLDGSFDTLFFSHPTVREALRRADVKSRRILRLENTSLSDKTPLHHAAFWLDVQEL